ncbi:AmmeMemoRadiSam system radical SAM enzyme [Phascolarctobacterium sp.]
MSNIYTEDAKKFNLHLDWNHKTKEAYLYDKKDNKIVQCKLCPRRCLIQNGNVGFCKVRKNIDGILYALSYELATHVTIEKIETEAIFHYMPGSNILSLGNFGCNLDCDYCQNWKYSQFQYTDPKFINRYTSDDIVQIALDNNVNILSWTYNDPAVWFEFVIDTARKAKEHGIKSLFKSAFYLTEEAVEQLCEVIDIFAISIKAMDEEYYKKFTKGTLPPVLKNAEIINSKGIHFEVSNLVVTDITNNMESYDKMIDFVLNKLSPDIPLHFTRFHPDYKYTNVEKTPIEDVNNARIRALSRGLKYAYIGNVFSGEGLNTYCPNCKELLIERHGLYSYLKDNIDVSGKCMKCGYTTNIVMENKNG